MGLYCGCGFRGVHNFAFWQRGGKVGLLGWRVCWRLCYCQIGIGFNTDYNTCVLVCRFVFGLRITLIFDLLLLHNLKVKHNIVVINLTGNLIFLLIACVLHILGLLRLLNCFGCSLPNYHYYIRTSFHRAHLEGGQIHFCCSNDVHWTWQLCRWGRPG